MRVQKLDCCYASLPWLRHSKQTEKMSLSVFHHSRSLFDLEIGEPKLTTKCARFIVNVITISNCHTDRMSNTMTHAHCSNLITRFQCFARLMILSFVAVGRVQANRASMHHFARPLSTAATNKFVRLPVSDRSHSPFVWMLQVGSRWSDKFNSRHLYGSSFMLNDALTFGTSWQIKSVISWT